MLNNKTTAINIYFINGTHGYLTTMNGRQIVLLLFKDILNKLNLCTQIELEKESLSKEFHSCFNESIQQNKDPIISQMIPIVSTPESYIPAELIIDTLNRCKFSSADTLNLEIQTHTIPNIIGSEYNKMIQQQQSNAFAMMNFQQQLMANTPFGSSFYDVSSLFKGDESDVDNAYRIYYVYKDIIKYIKETKEFAVYNEYKDSVTGGIGGYWVTGDTRILRPLITEFAVYLRSKAKTNEEINIASRLKDDVNILHAMNSLIGIRGIIMSKADFDNKPYLLNVRNGVIDLRTGEFRNADSKDHITLQIPVIYNPNATCPLFDSFIKQILPDKETRNAVLRYLGYCLTGETREQKALFMVGSGGNGKSTLLETILKLFGSYSASLNMNAFIEPKFKNKSIPTPDRAKIIGKRFVVIDEIKQGDILDAGEFKLLTGVNTIPFRRLHKDSDEFTNPSHKFIFSGNYLPELKDDRDGGLLRRLMVVEFPVRFKPEQMDSYLLDKLTTPGSLSGLLNLLVNEAMLYYQLKLFESPAMIAAKENYILGQNKLIRDFIYRYCIPDANAYILNSELEAKISEVYPSITFVRNQGQLKEVMKSLGYEQNKIYRGEYRNKWAYFGIRKKW